jgi:hypothetical protein
VLHDVHQSLDFRWQACDHSQEASSGDEDSANMVPAERRLVDLREGKSSALIGVFDMRKVVVEVVERGVPAGGLVDSSHGVCEALPRESRV